MTKKAEFSEQMGFRKKSNNFWGQKTLCPYPHVGIQVFLISTHVQKISLVPANAFIVKFHGPKGLEEQVKDWLIQYSLGKGFSSSLPLAWNNATHFTLETSQFLQKIPFGECKSYADIAKEVGNPRASRAIGNVCRNNPFPLYIPCHRVIQKSGKLGGFSCGLELKKQLLEFEGNKF